MKVIGWVWAALAGLFAVAAFSDGMVLAGSIFAIAAIISSPVVQTRQILSSFSLEGRRLGVAVALVSFAGLVAIGATAKETPQAKVQRLKDARERDEAAAREQAAEKKKLEEAASKKAEEKRKGFHCLSSWDGAHRGIVDYLKQNLRNPSSYEHIETRIMPVDKKGNHLLMMKYRAENGFGGMNVETLVAIVKNSDCSFEIVSAG